MGRLLEFKAVNLFLTRKNTLHKNLFFKEKQKKAVHLLKDLNLVLDQGESLAIVGESGCGKSLTLTALMQLLGDDTKTQGEIIFDGKSLLALSEQQKRKIRGAQIAMIFQDPMNALNPTMKVGEQIAEVLRIHKKLSNKEIKQKVIKLLTETGIADAATRYQQYPFEFSGGMLQRVVIAMVLAGEPRLMLADEPTTALDVTVQKQVLNLIKAMQKKTGMSLVLVSHDLAVVAETADKVLVMYAGEFVESSDVYDLFENPSHPYTQGLLKSLPELSHAECEGGLYAIEGAPPDLTQDIPGCAFVDRCAFAMNICARQKPPMFAINTSHQVRCWLFNAQAQEQNTGLNNSND